MDFVELKLSILSIRRLKYIKIFLDNMYLFINSNENCIKFHENSIYMNKKLDLIRKKFQKKRKN